MAYTTIMDLPELTGSDNSQTYQDWLMVTRDNTSYRMSAGVMKTIFTDIFYTEDAELWNKVLTSPSNLIHANTLQFTCKAEEPLCAGDMVMISKSGIEPNIASVLKHNGTNSAIGLVKEDADIGHDVTVITSGLYDNFDGNHPIDTSMFNKGDILFANNGTLTNVKPSSGLEQQVGVVVASNETQGALLLNFDGQIEKSSQIEFDRTVSNVSSSNVQDALDEIWSILYTEMYTSDRIMISNNHATLPRIPVGTIVNDMAMIFDDYNTNVFEDYTCSVTGTDIVFDPQDYLDGRYAKVSYLTIKI